MAYFDVSNPDSYPQELKRLYTASHRIFKAAQSAFDQYLAVKYDSRDERLWRFYNRYYPIAYALGYRAAVIGANLKLESGEIQSYINLMSQASDLYTRLLRALDYEYVKPKKPLDFVYLGGAISESTAKARMTKAKRDKNPQERPLSFKPFTIRLDDGRTDKASAAIIGAYAYVSYCNIWLICEAKSGKPLAKSGKGITKRGAHVFFRPLSKVMPQDSAALFTVDYWSDEPTKRFELCGLDLTDGNGRTEYEAKRRGS